MKYLALILAVATFATVGCRKHEDGSSPSATLGGTGATTVQHYSGTVDAMTGCFQTCKQTIAVNADVIDHPTDQVSVYLCRNADCRVSIPATSCAGLSLADSVTTPCASSRGPDIVLGKNTVVLVNAFATTCVDSGCTVKVPGYSSYAIQTVVVR